MLGNAGYNVVTVYSLLVQIWFAASKMGVSIYYKKLLIRVGSRAA